MKRFLGLGLILGISYFFSYNTKVNNNHLPAYEIKQATGTITIDGNASEADWSGVSWRNMDQNWLTSATPGAADFSGKYKLLYDKDYLYVLAEITDDVIADNRTNPTDGYSDDDCLEIFVDENASGGPHRTNYNAFAYHISTLGDWVDAGPNGAATYNAHGNMAKTNVGTVHTWECRLKLYPDNYIDGGDNIPSVLKKGKKIGFMLAYCDSDGNTATSPREHFMGSYPIPGTNKNRGWLDASLFEKMYLK
jgi:hypothetical protein